MSHLNLTNGMEEPVYRLGRLEDVPDIVELVNAAYRPASNEQGWTHEAALVRGDRTSPKQVEDLFTTDSWALVLTVRDWIAACVHVKRGGQVCLIGMLATHPRLQGQGLGHQMLACAERFALSSCLAMRIEIAVLSGRPELLAFYKRRNYVLTGRADPYPSGSNFGVAKLHELEVLYMNKDLSGKAKGKYSKVKHLLCSQ